MQSLVVAPLVATFSSKPVSGARGQKLATSQPRCILNIRERLKEPILGPRAVQYNVSRSLTFVDKAGLTDHRQANVHEPTLYAKNLHTT